MIGVLQRSHSRGVYREPVKAGVTSDEVHSQIVTDRPNPIKIGWTIWDVASFGPATLPTTGYNPGSLYFVLPTAQAVNIGNAIVQQWLLTDVPQATGFGNWILVSSFGGGSAGSTGGDGGGGAGGGDGGSG